MTNPSGKNVVAFEDSLATEIWACILSAAHQTSREIGDGSPYITRRCRESARRCRTAAATVSTCRLRCPRADPTRSPTVSERVMSRSASITTTFDVLRPMAPPDLPRTVCLKERVLASKIGNSTHAWERRCALARGKKLPKIRPEPTMTDPPANGFIASCQAASVAAGCPRLSLVG